MSLTVAEFERGVAYWLEQTKWDRDFHNGFYKTMAAVNPHGDFDDSWWAGFLPVLHRWRATRPRSGDFLTPRAQSRYASMSQAWAAVVEPNLGSSPEPWCKSLVGMVSVSSRRQRAHLHDRLGV